MARKAVGAVKKRRNLVLGNHAPEGTGIRRSDRLAFIDNGRRADQQRRIGNVGMADNPTHIGCRPEHFARLDVVDGAHRPGQRHHVAAIVAHHALWLAGRAGCVENVERVGRIDPCARNDGACRLVRRNHCRIVNVPACNQITNRLLALENQAMIRLVAGHRQSPCRASACRRRRGPARCRRRRR